MMFVLIVVKVIEDDVCIKIVVKVIEDDVCIKISVLLKMMFVLR